MNQASVPGTKLPSLVSGLSLDNKPANYYRLKYLIDIYELKMLESKHDINQQKQLLHASWASLFAIRGSADFKHRYVAKSGSKDGNSRSFRGRITSISDYVSAYYM